MLTRHNQDMDRRPGTDVSECNYRFISVNHIAFNLAFNNAAEKTIAHQLPLSIRFRAFDPVHARISNGQRSFRPRSQWARFGARRQRMAPKYTLPLRAQRPRRGWNTSGSGHR